MGMHENCHELLKSLSEYVDGELPAELCAAIERHMSGCENCRIVVDTLRKTISLYQSEQAALPELPAPVRQRLYKRLNLDEFIP
jgi:anti-sigma factor RsiW